MDSKYQLINVETHEVLAKGICERVGSAEAFHKHGIDENEVVIDTPMPDHNAAMALVLEALTSGPTKAIDSWLVHEGGRALGNVAMRGAVGAVLADGVLASPTTCAACARPPRRATSAKKPRIDDLYRTTVSPGLVFRSRKRLRKLGDLFTASF